MNKALSVIATVGWSLITLNDFLHHAKLHDLVADGVLLLFLCLSTWRACINE